MAACREVYWLERNTRELSGVMETYLDIGVYTYVKSWSCTLRSVHSAACKLYSVHFFNICRSAKTATCIVS